MIRGLYSSATGIEAATIRQEFLAENLANFQQPGYFRRGVTFQTFEQTLQGVQAGNLPLYPQQKDPPTDAVNFLLGTQPGVGYTNFVEGPLQFTGNPLDLAATGNAFFVVEGPGGQFLTKNGAFTLNSNNQLETANGFRVRGQGGPIAIPTDANRIVVTQDGIVYADDNQIDRLQIAVVPNPQSLQRAGNTLYYGSGTNEEPAPGSIRIEQGYRDQSNTSAVEDMVNLVVNQRYLEANDRALRSLSDVLTLVTRPQT